MLLEYIDSLFAVTQGGSKALRCIDECLRIVVHADTRPRSVGEENTARTDGDASRHHGAIMAVEVLVEVDAVGFLKVYETVGRLVFVVDVGDQRDDAGLFSAVTNQPIEEMDSLGWCDDSGNDDAATNTRVGLAIGIDTLTEAVFTLLEGELCR